MKKVLVILFLLPLAVVQAMSPKELGDSIHAWCEFPSCVPNVRVKSIRQSGSKVTLQCNKLLTGRALTKEGVRDLKEQVAEWLNQDGANPQINPQQVVIMTEDGEIGDLVVTRRELRPLASDAQPLRGKNIVLWASHGRYYKPSEQRWVWQRARLWGTVEDRLTTEYTTRLTRLLEASGAHVFQPRAIPGDSVGEETGASGMKRWMESATYYQQHMGYAPTIWQAKGVGEDYKNDMICRPRFVNYLTDTLGIHVDMALALHTDGCDEPGDSASAGTLTIYYDRNDEGRRELRDGRNRAKTNRQMAYAIHRRIVSTMRTVAPGWGDRQVWNSNYAEARIPNVPTVLIEMGSHKDFNDIRYLLNPHCMDRIVQAIYEGICENLGADGYVPYPAPSDREVTTCTEGHMRVINAFTTVSGPEWFADEHHAGVVPGRYGIADSVSYALIGIQHEFDRTRPWVSDDDCGWGMCDTRWQHLLTKGNEHHYHTLHMAVLRDSLLRDGNTSLLDILLGQEKPIPHWVNDSIRTAEQQGTPVIVSGAYIGAGPMVRESRINRCTEAGNGASYLLYTEPNETALYCNESRSLVFQPGDVVLYRWSESGLPAIIRRGNTLCIGTMLESIQDWEKLYAELLTEILPESTSQR